MTNCCVVRILSIRDQAGRKGGLRILRTCRGRARHVPNSDSGKVCWEVDFASSYRPVSRVR